MVNELIDNPSFLEKDARIFLESQGSGVKEKFNNIDLVNQEVNIKPDDEVILIGPDNGNKGEKDEGSVPNLHNGLFRIHAYLYEYGTKSAMINLDIDNMDQAWELVRKHKPPFIGFSPYYDTSKRDLKNIDRALELSPNSIIVIGGYEASLNPQWRDLGGLIDILVRGEGEIPMLNLAREYRKFSKSSNGNGVDKKKFLGFLKDNPIIKNIPAISVLEAGKTAEITPLERITDKFYEEISLNAFEKHLDLSPIEKYWKVSRAMFGGRKDSYFRFITRDFCPYKCTFCESPVLYAALMGKKSSGAVRIVEPENTIKIIKAITKKFPYLDIMIDDDNFLVYPASAKKTLEMIIEAKENGEIRKNLEIQTRTRTDNIVNNPEICKLFKQAGVKMLSIGSESYSQHELDSMKKGTSPEINLNAVKLMLEAGIVVAENYLIFTPHITKDSFYENAKGIVRNIRDFNVDGSVNLFLSPIPSTPLWGDGKFEKVLDFPYQDLYPGKIMFRNEKLGYEYLGEEISVPRTNIVLPHPELVLLKDSLMRDISMRQIQYLPKALNELKEINRGANLSRSFVSLGHLMATSNLLYRRTSEPRWYELEKEIEEIVRKRNFSS